LYSRGAGFGRCPKLVSKCPKLVSAGAVCSRDSPGSTQEADDYNLTPIEAHKNHRSRRNTSTQKARSSDARSSAASKQHIAATHKQHTLGLGTAEGGRTGGGRLRAVTDTPQSPLGMPLPDAEPPPPPAAALSFLRASASPHHHHTSSGRGGRARERGRGRGIKMRSGRKGGREGEREPSSWAKGGQQDKRV